MKNLRSVWAAMYLISFCYCSPNLSNESKLTALQLAASKEFLQLGIKTINTFTQKDENIKWQLHYTEKYFLTDATNLTLIGYLLYTIDSLIPNKVEQIDVFYTREGLVGTYSINLDVDELRRLQAISSAKLQRHLIKYIVTNVNTEEVIGFDFIINRLSEDDLFNSKWEKKYSGFWNLLSDYSNNCCNKNSNVNKQLRVLGAIAELEKMRSDVIDGIQKIAEEHCRIVE